MTYSLLALMVSVLSLLVYASTRYEEFRVVLQPTPDGATEVIWQMHGPANFMDKMVGRDLKDGLQNLRQIAEASNVKGA